MLSFKPNKIEINDSIKKFYLGDGDAYWSVYQTLYPNLAEHFINKFEKVVDDEIRRIIELKFTEFYSDVTSVHQSLPDQIRRHPYFDELPEEQTLQEVLLERKDGNLEKFIVELCQNETSYELTGSFQNWFQSCIEHKIIDKIRSKKYKIKGIEYNFQEIPIDDPDNNIYNQLPTTNDQYDLNEDDIDTLKKILMNRLPPDEKMYFELFLEEKTSPSVNKVKEAFSKPGKEFSDKDVSDLKYDWRISTLLILLEEEWKIVNLKNFFGKLISSKSTSSRLHRKMIDFIWVSFDNDENQAKSIVIREFPRLNQIINDMGVYRIQETQTFVLKRAYDFFKQASQHPRFVQLIDIYSAHKLGRRLKEIFNGGNNE